MGFLSRLFGGGSATIEKEPAAVAAPAPKPLPKPPRAARATGGKKIGKLNNTTKSVMSDEI